MLLIVNQTSFPAVLPTYRHRSMLSGRQSHISLRHQISADTASSIGGVAHLLRSCHPGSPRFVVCLQRPPLSAIKTPQITSQPLGSGLVSTAFTSSPPSGNWVATGGGWLHQQSHYGAACIHSRAAASSPGLFVARKCIVSTSPHLQRFFSPLARPLRVRVVPPLRPTCASGGLSAIHVRDHTLCDSWRRFMDFL